LLAGCVVSRLIFIVLNACREHKQCLSSQFTTTVFAVFFPLLVFFSSNNTINGYYPINTFRAWGGDEIQPITDYRSTARFVRDNYLPGDKVIALMPHAFEYYSGKENEFFLQNYPVQQVFYNAWQNDLRYRDKFTGTPVIRNINELRSELTHADRIWIIAAPVGLYLENSEKSLREYLTSQTKIMFEGFMTEVYLWRN
jgi:hypothetical protein